MDFCLHFIFHRLYWLSHGCSSTYFNRNARDILSPQRLRVSRTFQQNPPRSWGITAGFLLLFCVFAQDCIASFGITLNSWHTHTHTAGRIIPRFVIFIFLWDIPNNSCRPVEPEPSFSCTVHNRCCCLVSLQIIPRRRSQLRFFVFFPP